MLLLEESEATGVEEFEERVEEVEEEEEGGELAIEQLKLLVNVTRMWHRVLQGLESIESIVALSKTPSKATRKKKAAATRAKKPSKKRARKASTKRR